MRRRVDQLLADHLCEDSFLEKPAAEVSTTIKVNLAIEETTGDRIGRCKLLQKIGEGGMGVVYMAEQMSRS